jgi:hypothetical protein
MSNVQYFDEETGYFDEEAAGVDDAVQAMARRQFGVSLVVAFALLAIAGLAAAQAPRNAPAQQMAARHKIIRVEAPQFVVAQPAAPAMTKG